MVALVFRVCSDRPVPPAGIDDDAIDWRRMQKQVCALQRRIDDAVSSGHWRHVKSLRRSMRRLVSANAAAVQIALERARSRQSAR